MHALGLESGFSSTKHCRVFKQYAEKNISREELEASIPIPADRYWARAEAELRDACRMGIRCVSITSENYPGVLFEIEDPPLILFINSKKECPAELISASRLFAIVGSRKITPYGVSVTKKISRAVCEAGFTVVSGLAYGVDKCAHEGALNAKADFPTVAVLGSGLVEVYPSLHRKLALDIIEAGGCVISEYGLYQSPRGYLFPRRNRIISGLSSGVLVVEAEERSGSLITARLALEQGRDVYAVPGAIDAPCSAGCNKILSEGATPVRSVSHIVELLCDALPKATRKSPKRKLSRLKPEIIVSKPEELKNPGKEITDQESLLIKKLREGYSTYDKLQELGLFSDAELHILLVSLQMSDFIQEVSGSYVVIE